MPTRMHPAVGFQLFVLLLAALCISAVEASRPSSSSGDEIHSKGKSYDAETQSGHKHGHHSGYKKEYHEPKPKVHHHHERKTYSIGLWGDLPYTATQAIVGVPNLIEDMNKENLAFTIYDGDWKPGSPATSAGTKAILNCSDELYTVQIAGYLNSLEAPAMHTPGDNEWTDCDRNSNAFGATYNSLNRLSFIRKTFFNDKYSQGQRRLEQEVQADKCWGWNGTDPQNRTAGQFKEEACSENRRWVYKNVMYVTLNMPGSCNNLCEEFPDRQEYEKRNAANLKWMQESFTKAKTDGIAGVMIVSQANPGFTNDTAYRSDYKRDPRTYVGCRSIADNTLLTPFNNWTVTCDPDPLKDGYKDFMIALRNHVRDFKRPVAYVHGDSHVFLVDKPMFNETGFPINNFTRIVTVGDGREYANYGVNWVKAEVDPTSRYIWKFIPMVVRANSPDQIARRLLSCTRSMFSN